MYSSFYRIVVLDYCNVIPDSVPGSPSCNDHGRPHNKYGVTAIRSLHAYIF